MSVVLIHINKTEDPEDECENNIIFLDDQPCENGASYQHFGAWLCHHHQGLMLNSFHGEDKFFRNFCNHLKD